jgi:hypothetical protein
MSVLKDSYLFAQFAFLAMSTGLDMQQFVRISAHDFFWGYDDTLFSMARTYSSLTHDVPYKKFGILVKVTSLRKIATFIAPIRLNQFNFVITVYITAPETDDNRQTITYAVNMAASETDDNRQTVMLLTSLHQKQMTIARLSRF